MNTWKRRGLCAIAGGLSAWTLIVIISVFIHVARQAGFEVATGRPIDIPFVMTMAVLGGLANIAGCLFLFLSFIRSTEP
jgi:hypothetical protein